MKTVKVECPDCHKMVKNLKSHQRMAHTAQEPAVLKKEPLLNHNRLMIIVGAVCIVFGLVLGKFWLDTAHVLLGIGCLAGVGGGIYLIKHYWSRGDEVEAVIVEPGKPSTSKFVPVLEVSPEVVKFCTIEAPQGQPRRCRNDNKWYYVHIIHEGKSAAFALPDQQYYDPRVFAQRVLELPAHRRIFRRKETLLQKLQPLILVAAIAVVWILILTTTGE